jgi:hypothetical protein
MNYIKYFFFRTEDCLLNGDKKVKHKFYLKENFQYIKTKHFFHLVDSSLWPLVSALGVLMVILLNFFLPSTLADLKVLFIVSLLVGFFTWFKLKYGSLKALFSIF